jgi:hypothetical protein
MNTIIPKIAEIKNVIFVDDIAYNYYMDYELSKINHLGIILPKDKNNSQNVYNILVDAIAKEDINFKEHMKVDEYNTFFQYWEQRIIISYKNKPIVTIYSNKDKCLPFREIEFNKNKINIANFTLTLLYYLVQYIYNGIFRLKFKESEYRIGNLLDMRNRWLSENKKTVLDDTKYREFQIECLGEAIAFKRKKFLNIASRKERGSTLVYRYIPDSKNNSLTREYKFPNEAGTLIQNSNLKYIQV